MEELKQFEEILLPDIRSICKVLINKDTRETKAVDLQWHYKVVEQYQLNNNVPEKIRNHYATALNILLYSWYFYPFCMIAELHALVTLEFAIREKIGQRGLAELKSKNKKHGLFNYIEYVVDKGWIRNEDFSAYHRAPRLKAEQERIEKNIRKMIDNDLDILVDDEELIIPENDSYDFLGVLKDIPNKVRNDIAHGSNSLNQEVWITFEYCTEFINKIYNSAEDAK